MPGPAAHMHPLPACLLYRVVSSLSIGPSAIQALMPSAQDWKTGELA